MSELFLRVRINFTPPRIIHVVLELLFPVHGLIFSVHGLIFPVHGLILANPICHCALLANPIRHCTLSMGDSNMAARTTGNPVSEV